MIAAPRFLVAKFTPDILRMEPKNFGVVVWSGGSVAAKFAGERGDGAIIPPRSLHVQSRSAYRKWIEYWRALMNKPSLANESGHSVDRNKPEFVDQLLRASKRQFRLIDGGEFQIDIPSSEIHLATQELFDALVATENDEPVKFERANASRELLRACKTAIAESGLKDRAGFWGMGGTGFSWPCPVGATTQAFHFDFAIHFTKPVAILDRVHLWKHEDAYSTAFEFTKMREEYGIPRENCASLIYPTESDLNDKNFVQLWKMMDDIGIVIDMRDVRAASSRLRSFALVT